MAEKVLRPRPEGNPGADGWFLESPPMQICGRLTQDVPSTRLQGGATLTSHATSERRGNNSTVSGLSLESQGQILALA